MTTQTYPALPRVKHTDSGLRHDTGLIGSLNHEWATTLAETPVPTTWALPAHVATLEDLRLEITTNTPAARDVLLHALITHAGSNDHTAGRVIVQVMLGKVVNLSRTAHNRGIEDPVETVLTALWGVISTYPLRRHTSITGNLALDTLNKLPAAQPHPADFLNPNLHETSPETYEDETHVATTLAWAQRQGLLTDSDVQLIARMTLAEDADDINLHVAAAQMGIPHAVLRKRYSRAVNRLADAVRTYLGADPDHTL